MVEFRPHLGRRRKGEISEMIRGKAEFQDGRLQGECQVEELKDEESIEPEDQSFLASTLS
jgi:hypothetical protein